MSRVCWEYIMKYCYQAENIVGRYIHPILGECRASAADGEAALSQYWVSAGLASRSAVTNCLAIEKS